ncbi:unnamed protein product [Callosobruchus maculatus]|uniref:SAP domain-containing protein n=1 Tax=Callosobruchus maculatus TaxID=64391 RepID=A0A653BFH4_CALMS|nr:unnamed protein product [Callosobruchus maculatus]
MADESVTVLSSDFSKMKVPDLKKELKMRGLSTSGNKTELIERLQGAVKSTDSGGNESVDDLEEDLLNDDDDDHIDANESVLESVLDDAITSQKRKAEDTSKPESKSLAPPPPKKVILNRNNSCSSETAKPIAASKESEPIKESKNGDAKNAEGTKEDKSGKTVIKLSQLTAKERLELRAKKFGVSAVTTDIKKAVRAERFGLSDNSANSITSDKTAPSVDILQKRAARFGGSVSSVMSSLENQEKLEKRKARFGTVSISNGTTVSAADKAKERLERFKQPVK